VLKHGFPPENIHSSARGFLLRIAEAPRTVPSHAPLRVDSSHDQKTKNNSIPIDSGPAQFNAFYPPCSGPKSVPLSGICSRSTADRILDIIIRICTSWPK
jgi:hypothetical protein